MSDITIDNLNAEIAKEGDLRQRLLQSITNAQVALQKCEGRIEGYSNVLATLQAKDKPVAGSPDLKGKKVAAKKKPASKAKK